MLARRPVRPLRSAMPSWLTPARGAIAGVLVGGALVAAVAAESPARRHTTGSGVLADRRSDDSALLAAWRRSRETTWSVRLHLDRRTSGGGQLATDIRIAQRPPEDRKSTRLNS